MQLNRQGKWLNQFFDTYYVCIILNVLACWLQAKSFNDHQPLRSFEKKELLSSRAHFPFPINVFLSFSPSFREFVSSFVFFAHCHWVYILI